MRELDREPADVAVRFVTIGDRAKADAFCGPYGAASLCMNDETKSTYRAMGFGDYNLMHLFTNAALRKRRDENVAAGFKQNWKATKISDGAQLPGAAAIDAEGVIRWLHRGRHPGDLPPLADMLGAARAALHAGEPSESALARDEGT